MATSRPTHLRQRCFPLVTLNVDMYNSSTSRKVFKLLFTTTMGIAAGL